MMCLVFTVTWERCIFFIRFCYFCFLFSLLPFLLLPPHFIWSKTCLQELADDVRQIISNLCLSWLTHIYGLAGNLLNDRKIVILVRNSVATLIIILVQFSFSTCYINSLATILFINWNVII